MLQMSDWAAAFRDLTEEEREELLRVLSGDEMRRRKAEEDKRLYNPMFGSDELRTRVVREILNVFALYRPTYSETTHVLRIVSQRVSDLSVFSVPPAPPALPGPNISGADGTS